MEIRYVDRSLGNNFGSFIELNEHLKEYPQLHTQILNHELKHSSIKGFTKQDFVADMNSTKIDYKQLFKFMLKYPKSLWQFVPFYIQKGQFVYDINMCIVWGVVLFVSGLAIFLGMRL